MPKLTQVTWLGLGHLTPIVSCDREGKNSIQGRSHNLPLLVGPNGDSRDGPFPCSRPCHLLERAADGKGPSLRDDRLGQKVT